jgi:hypothetical protein
MGRRLLPFVVFQSGLLDMRTKLTVTGQPILQRYASGWINTAVLKPAYLALLRAVQEKTGYVINDSAFKGNSDDLYVTTVANLAENNSHNFISSAPVNSLRWPF